MKCALRRITHEALDAENLGFVRLDAQSWVRSGIIAVPPHEFKPLCC
jgi:hypothetical protein